MAQDEARSRRRKVSAPRRKALPGIVIVAGLMLAGGGSTEAVAQTPCQGASQTQACTTSGGTVTITPDNASIKSTITGSSPYVVYADAGGKITGRGIIIEAIGGSGANTGAVMVRQSSQIILTGGSITTHENSLAGVMHMTDRAGTFTLNDLSVTTEGGASTGLWARGVSGLIDATNVTVTTSGAGAYGGQSSEGGSGTNGGSLNLTRGSINTRGSGAHGVYLWDFSSLTLNGGSITTGDPNDPSKGAGSHGIYAVSHSAITLKADTFGKISTVTTWGANAYGVAVSDAAVSITDTHVTSTKFGAFYLSSDPASGSPLIATINKSVLTGVTGIQTYSPPTYQSLTVAPLTINLSNGSQIIADGGNGNALHVTRGGGPLFSPSMAAP